ncbi:NAD(P)-binding protein [Aaosphaeria arxii CBS 175.79]|uniref:NAD(P)-binding protein n=1 Tax=Aaosphaeria arxii CBS 175.79 TaxID=1450172 RepID=A0A6A5XCQ6_9PLEO|nr:NAD(P)-binding protein [Aaosphaeria arxii CBS 175.79]KAF2010554.1 NAD(P)-binding protein [Aaosphaeria arxii CBS 175.79]
MKVLLIGATGNLGLRLVAALLTHNHTVVAFVRSAQKLQNLVPESIYRQISVVQGSAKDSDAIKRAILDANCDAVVNTAGVAAMAPWAKGDLPEIFKAVVEGVKDAGEERKKPLRTWFLAGQSVLCYPGTQSMLSDFIPIFLEHRQNLSLLHSLPPNSIDWSLLCPNTMIPSSATITVPASPTSKLSASATVPPSWKDSWVRHVPLLGRRVVCAMNASKYKTTLEQNAEFIAADLEAGQSQWSGKTVGVIDESNV